MEYIDHKITLDIHRTVSPVTLNMKRRETGHRLLIRLAEKGYPFHISDGCYAVFTARKPDGKVVFNDCTIEDCVIAYKVTEQTTAVAGMLCCEIQLYGADSRLIVSPSFYIVVEDTVYDEETEIESTSEFNALTALIAEVQKLKEGLEDEGSAGPSIPVECNDVYVLADGETLDDAPEEALIVIDPNAEYEESEGNDTETVTNPVTHEWNGTVLSITSASGTSSADLKGDPGPQGIQGEKGDKGSTPAKGVDYFTEADKSEIAAIVKELLPKYIPAVLTSEFYGDTLPEPGTPGRIFFKKVTE
jgi:hypothetical protein